MSIELPYRNSRWHRLTAEEKTHNRVFSSIRIKVEHVIAQLKRVRILAEHYRHRLADYDAASLAIVGIVNRRTDERLRLSALAWGRKEISRAG